MSTLVQISAGVGPREVRGFVAQLATQLQRELVVLARDVRGPGHAPRSVELLVEGDVTPWLGTHELVAPKRGPGARRRWFCEVRAFAPSEGPSFDEADCTIRVCRAGGPGGQHVNRRNTAVRATHRPTGLTVRAERERSQAQNRRAALNQLRELVADRARAHEARAIGLRRHAHHQLTRGNPDHRWHLDRRGRLRKRP